MYISAEEFDLLREKQERWFYKHESKTAGNHRTGRMICAVGCSEEYRSIKAGIPKDLYSQILGSVGCDPTRANFCIMWKSQKTLATDLGLPRPRINEAMKRLISAGLVAKTRRLDGTGTFNYLLLVPESLIRDGLK